MVIGELELAMTDKDDIIAELEAQLAETEQFLEQVHSFCLTVLKANVLDLQKWEERNETMPVDFDTICKHVHQLNELMADGSEVRFAPFDYDNISYKKGNLHQWSHLPSPAKCGIDNLSGWACIR